MINEQWRFALLLPLLFGAYRIIAILFKYRLDTPRYYYSKGDIKLGRMALSEIYNDNFIEEEEKQMLKRFLNENKVK